MHPRVQPVRRSLSWEVNVRKGGVGGGRIISAEVVTRAAPAGRPSPALSYILSYLGALTVCD